MGWHAILNICGYELIRLSECNITGFGKGRAQNKPDEFIRIYYYCLISIVVCVFLVKKKMEI